MTATQSGRLPRARLAPYLVLFAWMGLWTYVSAQDLGPDLNGPIWQPVNSKGSLAILLGSTPPLRDAAREQYRQHQLDRRAGKTEFDSMERCDAPGLPRLLLQPMAFEFLQTRERLFIHYQWNRLVRVVEMADKQSEPPIPLLLGQSIARWQGSSLLIDSVGFSDNTLLDDSGLPHSDRLHLTEKYRLSNNGRWLSLVVTIDDPAMYARPWTVTLAYRRVDGETIAEDVCVERKGVVFWKSKP